MKIRRFKAIIFDLDGVVIDSEVIHGEAKRKTLEEFGVPSAREIVDRFKGVSDTLFAETIFGIKPTIQVLEVLHRKQVHFDALHNQMKLVPGFEEFASRMKELELRLALATSASRKTQEAAFARFNLDRWFEVVQTADDSHRPKPSPDVYLNTLSDLDLRPEQCLVIEDSINGVLSAVSAGCSTVAFNTTFSTDALRAAGAQTVCSGFFELLTDQFLTI